MENAVDTMVIQQLRRPIMKTTSQTHVGQIWSTKHPSKKYCYIAMKCPDMLRVQSISFETQNASYKDAVITDQSYFGKDFMIETWTEQPCLEDMLNELVGHINPKTVREHISYDDTTNLAIEEFRELELENSAYIRSSAFDSFKWE
jgi:hypothetical protein